MPRLPSLRNKRLPWYILDTENNLLITSPTIPLSIKDAKPIIFAESAVPGLNYTPLTPNRLGNNRISFTIPIINRKGKFGNSNLMAAFELLRNQDNPGFADLFGRASQFRSNPTVIYSWGTNRPPLRYFVRKCDFDHTATLTNSYGYSQYTMVDMELEVDETSSLYRAWRILRKAQSIAGLAQATKTITSNKGRPY